MERPQNFQFDTRIRRRVLAKGLVTQEQVDAHLRSLPDREGQYIVLDVSQPAVSPAPMTTPPGPPPAAEPVAPVAPFGGGFDRFAPAAVSPSTTFAPDEDEAPLTPVMLSPRDLAASLTGQEALAGADADADDEAEAELADEEKQVDEAWATVADEEAESSPLTAESGHSSASETSEEETDASEDTP